jgi:hypothetical protein
MSYTVWITKYLRIGSRKLAQTIRAWEIFHSNQVHFFDGGDLHATYLYGDRKAWDAYIAAINENVKALRSLEKRMIETVERHENLMINVRCPNVFIATC